MQEIEGLEEATYERLENYRWILTVRKGLLELVDAHP
jgi:hypothetical protein